MRRLCSFSLSRHHLLESLDMFHLAPQRLLLAPESFILTTKILFLSSGGLRLLLDHADKRGHLLSQLVYLI